MKHLTGIFDIFDQIGEILTLLLAKQIISARFEPALHREKVYVDKILARRFFSLFFTGGHPPTAQIFALKLIKRRNLKLTFGYLNPLEATDAFDDDSLHRRSN